jgi:glycerol-3-phosphate dehydrogenase (NAD+)
LLRGSAIAKILAENAQEHPDIFEREVTMWVFEEEITLPEDSPHREQLGSKPVKLTQVINTVHENIKYLPGIRLPDNVVPNSSVQETVKGASVLIFNLPHQFMAKTLDQIRGHHLPYARGISCVKGVDVSGGTISLFSEIITEKLQIYCGALSGANIATEVAAEKWCETTIGYDPPLMDFKSSEEPQSENIRKVDEQRQRNTGHTRIQLEPMPQEYAPLTDGVIEKLFGRPYFHVTIVRDVAGVSLAGALKNIVALAAGFVAGKGWGDNAKAAIIRIGVLEMFRFSRDFFPDSVEARTFLEESAGIADVIASCSAGRNYNCARLSVERGVSIEEVEKQELNGQQLQGTDTAAHVHTFLEENGRTDQYPLFQSVYGMSSRSS